MKKIFVFGALLLLVGCADASKYSTVDANASVKTRMRACMISEATAKFQEGTLFTQGVSATSDDFVNISLRKLALTSAGISEESQSTEQSIIKNFKNFVTAN